MQTSTAQQRQSSAQLRHRELTQELADIGDELCTYIDNVSQAVADFDRELVEDCLAEFEMVLAQARADSRSDVVELIGLRRALLSSTRGPQISIPRLPNGIGEAPQPLVISDSDLRESFPLPSTPVNAEHLSSQLNGRTSMVVDHLKDTGTWVYEQCVIASVDPQAVFLPRILTHTAACVNSAAAAWMTTVAATHPMYCRSMRGTNPPEFLLERARVDAVIARVRARLKKNNASGGLVS